MLTLEHKRPTLRGRSVAQPAQQHHTLPRSARPTIRRMPSCACGGSCPRCQAKSTLKIGAPDDAYEREADAVADRVMRMADEAGPVTAAASGLQRKCAACENESEEPLLQAKAESSSTSVPMSAGPTSAPTSVDAVLRSPGQALDSATRAFFEPRFGRDYAGVQIHSDSAAQQSARDVNAHAYTVGHHIVFGPGRFAPGTSEGRRLLAHELVHVAQQNVGTAKGRLGAQRWTSPMLQRQQATCAIDVIQLSKLAGGDKSAALEVVNCCESGLGPLPSGCSADAVAAARKILGKGGKKGPTKADCRGLEGFSAAGSKDLIGQCCKGRENPALCCPPERISAKDTSPRCCNKDEVVQDGHCVKSTPAVSPACPPGQSKTIFGTCVPNKPSVNPPDRPPDKPPAAFTTIDNIVIEFKKDAPQSWDTFKTSVTAKGQAHFDELIAALTAQPDAKVQLESHASSDKPKGDEDYNKRLTDRRVKIVADELAKQKINAARVSDPPAETISPDCEEIATGQLSCGDVGASTPTDAGDRKVVAQIFTVTK